MKFKIGRRKKPTKSIEETVDEKIEEKETEQLVGRQIEKPEIIKTPEKKKTEEKVEIKKEETIKEEPPEKKEKPKKSSNKKPSPKKISTKKQTKVKKPETKKKETIDEKKPEKKETKEIVETKKEVKEPEVKEEAKPKDEEPTEKTEEKPKEETSEIIEEEIDEIIEEKKEEKKEKDKIKIMIVDDEKDILFSVEQVLKTCNYELIVADGGEKCFDLLKRGEIPDLIILDIMMPVLSGWEVQRRLERNFEWKNIPIIFLTARVTEAAKEMCMRLGEDYITKPFDVEDLKKRVKKVLEKKYILKV